MASCFIYIMRSEFIPNWLDSPHEANRGWGERGGGDGGGNERDDKDESWFDVKHRADHRPYSYHEIG